MRRIGIGLLLWLLALAVPASAQQQGVATFAYRYDLDSTALIYCRTTGQNGSPFGGPIEGPGGVKTVGNSVTIVESSTGSNPFAQLNVGDVIIYTNPVDGTTTKRVIVARTSAASVDVDTAVNWPTGVVFRWLKTTCGTDDAAGWIATAGLTAKVVTFSLEQIGGVTGGIDVRWECRSDAIGTLPNIIHPGASATASCGPGMLAGGYCNFTTAGIATGRMSLSIPRDVICGSVRVGMKINTSETAEAVEADKERISVTLDLAQ